ncbi:hypothetical protein [Streptomyces sp. NPDC057545]|uniref:hypothetical protein n=1 Tax=Streptomyces sp. NPDC057545 TaxID=3346164 RepID=UPI0036CB8E59
MDPELLERITARRTELDELEAQLAKQLTEVRAERDELAVAERVLERMTGQIAEERASIGPVPDAVIVAQCAAADACTFCELVHRPFHHRLSFDLLLSVPRLQSGPAVAAQCAGCRKLGCGHCGRP